MSRLPSVLLLLASCSSLGHGAPDSAGAPDSSSHADSGETDTDEADTDDTPTDTDAPDSGDTDVADADGDGYASPDDCDDANAGVNPEAAETFGDALDDDCDGYWDLDAATTTDLSAVWQGEDDTYTWDLFGLGGVVPSADLDHDGVADLVTTNGARVLALGSAATMAGGVHPLSTDSYVLAYAEGSVWRELRGGFDVDGDGLSDVALQHGTSLPSEAACLLFSSADIGTSTAVEPGSPYAAVYEEDAGSDTYGGTEVYDLVDADQDGLVDVIAGASTYGGLDHTGRIFWVSGTALARGAALRPDDADVMLAASEARYDGILVEAVPDLDGNGYPDVLLATRDAEYLVDGGILSASSGQRPQDIAQATWTKPGTPGVEAVSPGDVDGDGLQDLTALTSSGSLGVWLQLGAGGTWDVDTDADAYVVDSTSVVWTQSRQAVLRPGGDGDVVLLHGADMTDYALVPVSRLPITGSLDLAGWPDDLHMVGSGAGVMYPADVDGDGVDDLVGGFFDAYEGFATPSTSYSQPGGVIGVLLNPAP